MIKALDKPLQRYALGIAPSQLIGLNLLPKIATDAETVLIPKWNSNAFVIPDSTLRAMRANRATLEMGDFSSVEVVLDEHTFKYNLDIREKLNISRNLFGLNADRIATADSMLRLRIEQEKEIAGIVTDYNNYASGHYTTISDATKKWDTSTGDPIKDIEDAKYKVFKATGVYPTDIYMSAKIYDVLRRNATILDTMKTTADKIVTPQYLANYFGAKNVWVGTQTYKTSPTATPTEIWGNYFGMVVVNPTATNVPTPAFGITAEYANLNDTMKVDEVEAGKIFEYTPTLFYKPMVLMNNAGYLYINPIS